MSVVSVLMVLYLSYCILSVCCKVEFSAPLTALVPHLPCSVCNTLLSLILSIGRFFQWRMRHVWIWFIELCVIIVQKSFSSGNDSDGCGHIAHTPATSVYVKCWRTDAGERQRWFSIIFPRQSSPSRGRLMSSLWNFHMYAGPYMPCPLYHTPTQ